MSKAIQSFEVAISGSGAARSGAGRRPEQDESGAFSRLLSSGQAEAVDNDGAQDVPEGGNSLPGEQRRDPAGHAAECDPDTTAAPADPGPKAAVQQSANAPQDELSQGVDADLSAELPEGLHDPGLAQAVPDNTEAAGPQAVVHEPVAPVPAGVAGEAGQTGLPVEPPLAVSAPTAAAAASSTGATDPDRARTTTSDNPHAQGVREGVMQMLAARVAQGQSGESPGNGGNEQPASQDQAATARSAAGPRLFTDALSETAMTAPSSRVPAPVGQPGWGRAVGEQVVWFVAQNIRSASLRLNPQHLGPLELHVHMDGDKASIAFSSQHAQVRDALESSLPRLRDMFAEQGLNLVDVNVSQRDVAGHREQPADGYRSNPSAPASALDEGLPMSGSLPATVTGLGLVDYYV